MPTIDPPPPEVECSYCADSQICDKCGGSGIGCYFCGFTGACVYCLTALEVVDVQQHVKDLEEELASRSEDYDCRKDKAP